MKLDFLQTPRVFYRPYIDKLSKFKGRFYKVLADMSWIPYIPLPTGPINYLEIGCADGGNAIVISKSYANHPDSKVYCVDPWMDYDEYPEYKGEQDSAWENFNRNIQVCSDPKKFVVKRGFSDDIVPTFPDQFFDLVLVDGNHETEYVYRDGLMSLDKVKIGGYIVFDDYTIEWPTVMVGVDKFVKECASKIRVIGQIPIAQFIVQRTS